MFVVKVKALEREDAWVSNHFKFIFFFQGDENSKGDGDKTDAPSLLYACACHTYK